MGHLYSLAHPRRRCGGAWCTSSQPKTSRQGKEHAEERLVEATPLTLMILIVLAAPRIHDPHQPGRTPAALPLKKYSHHL
jgi:hypothetical protein